MGDWIRGIIGNIIGGAREIANAAVQAIVTFVDMLTATFARWLNAFGLMKDAAAAAATAALLVMVEVFVTAAWTVITKLPHAIAVAVDTVRSWAAALIRDLSNLVRGLVDAAIRLARQLVGDLQRLVTGWVNSIWDNLSKAVRLLNTVATRVFGLLTDPKALANWVAGAIVQAVFRWGVANATYLARLFLGGIMLATFKGAAVIEKVIADLL